MYYNVISFGNVSFDGNWKLNVYLLQVQFFKIYNIFLNIFYKFINMPEHRYSRFQRMLFKVICKLENWSVVNFQCILRLELRKLIEDTVCIWISWLRWDTGQLWAIKSRKAVPKMAVLIRLYSTALTLECAARRLISHTAFCFFDDRFILMLVTTSTKNDAHTHWQTRRRPTTKRCWE